MSRLQDKSCTFHLTFNRVSMEIGNRVVSVNIHVKWNKEMICYSEFNKQILVVCVTLAFS